MKIYSTFSAAIGLGFVVTSLVCASPAQAEEFRRVSKRRPKLLQGCTIAGVVDQVRISRRGRALFLPRELGRKRLRLPRRTRYYRCAPSSSNPAVSSLYIKRGRNAQEVEVPVSVDSFPARNTSANNPATSLRSQCSQVRKLPSGFIYKTIGSHHFSDVRRNTIGLIARRGVSLRWPGCISVLNEEGRKVGSLARYATNERDWAARFYAGIGCARREAFNGDAIARRARQGTGSKEIYFDFGDTCYGPVQADRCIASSQC